MDSDSDGIGDNDDIDMALINVPDSNLAECLVEYDDERVSDVTRLERVEQRLDNRWP